MAIIIKIRLHLMKLKIQAIGAFTHQNSGEINH